MLKSSQPLSPSCHRSGKACRVFNHTALALPAFPAAGINEVLDSLLLMEVLRPSVQQVISCLSVKNYSLAWHENPCGLWKTPEPTHPGPNLCWPSRSCSPQLHLIDKLRGLSAECQAFHTDPPSVSSYSTFPLPRRSFPTVLCLEAVW